MQANRTSHSRQNRPKHRFMQTPDGEPGLNYLCGYKHFFRHIDPYMQYMSSELRHQRPPANVMHWARERDRRTAGRNDRCPCGSGKKYKKCCRGAEARA